MTMHATMAKVGARQLESLIVLGFPNLVMITPGKVEKALVKKGLLENDGKGGVIITPNGLRTLADAMDTGDVARAMARMKKERAERIRLRGGLGRI